MLESTCWVDGCRNDWQNTCDECGIHCCLEHIASCLLCNSELCQDHQDDMLLCTTCKGVFCSVCFDKHLDDGCGG